MLASGVNTITATYSGDTNYAGSSGTVSVTYAPAPASFTLTSTTASVSSPGQSGSSTITIAPTNYTGTVNLSCVLATSPPGANATYNPILLNGVTSHDIKLGLRWALSPAETGNSFAVSPAYSSPPVYSPPAPVYSPPPPLMRKG